MKRFLGVLVGLFLIGSIALAQQTFKITYAEGEVYSQGNKLTTEEGKVEVHLGQGNFVRLNRKTQVEFIPLAIQGESANAFVEFNPLIIQEGNVYVVVKTGMVNVQAGNKTFICGQGTHRIDVKNDKASHFQGSRPIDPFGSWNLKHEREVNRIEYSPKETVCLSSYPWSWYSWRICGFWFWGPYSWYWSFYRSHYPHYHSRLYYRYNPDRRRTIINKDQLKDRHGNRIGRVVSKRDSSSGKSTRVRSSGQGSGSSKQKVGNTRSGGSGKVKKKK